MKNVFWAILACVVLLTCTVCSPALAQANEPEKITWFINRSALPSNWNLDEPIFKEITAATGVTCELIIPAEDPDTKLNLLMVSGQMPDIITTSNRNLIAEMVKSDMVWDLDEFFKTYLPDTHLFTDFAADQKNAMIKQDGGWYGYPSHIVSAGEQEIFGYPTQAINDYYQKAKYDYNFGIYFYKEYVDKLGIDVNAIKTEEQLFDALAKIAAAGLTSDTGASVYTMMTDGIYTARYAMNTILANTFGAMPVGDNGQYQSLYYSPEYRNAVSFLNGCGKLGYLTESQLIMDEPTVVSICNSGRSAVFIGGLSTLKSGADVVDKWVSPGAVVSTAGAKPVMSYNGTVTTGWLNTLVSKSTEKQAACAKFIDFMSSKKGMLLHMFGIEGTDYTYDADGCLHRTDAGNSKIEDGVSGMFGFYAFHNTAFARSVSWLDTTKESPTLKYGNSGNVVIYDGSLFNLPSGYVESGSSYAYTLTEVENYIEPAIAKLILAPDDATFTSMYDAFLQELDKLGLRAYDEYLNEQVQKNCAEKGVTLAPIN